MSIRMQQPTFSQPHRNCLHVLAAISTPNSKELHDIVLRHAPHDFAEIGSFGKAALKELAAIPMANPFDCLADVIRLLGALAEAGLVQIKHTEKRQGHHDRLIGAKVEYKLMHPEAKFNQLKPIDPEELESACVAFVKEHQATSEGLPQSFEYSVDGVTLNSEQVWAIAENHELIQKH